MEKQDFHASITSNIAPKKAIEMISNVPAWWATDFEGNSEKPGDVFTVRFGETFVTFRVAEVVPDKKIAWQVTDCNLHWISDKKEWKDSRINWEISTKGNATQIDFTHIGLVPEIECYKDCSKGWSFFVKESLFKLITEGKGLPEVPKNSRDGKTINQV